MSSGGRGLQVSSEQALAPHSWCQPWAPSRQVLLIPLNPWGWGQAELWSSCCPLKERQLLVSSGNADTGLLQKLSLAASSSYCKHTRAKVPSEILFNTIWPQFLSKIPLKQTNCAWLQAAMACWIVHGQDPITQHILVFLEIKELKVRTDCCLIYYQMGPKESSQSYLGESEGGENHNNNVSCIWSTRIHWRWKGPSEKHGAKHILFSWKQYLLQATGPPYWQRSQHLLERQTIIIIFLTR